jgi:hypothetical protein
MAAPTLLEIDATQQTLEITSSRDAISLRGRSIETGVPTDGEVMTYSTSSSEWIYQTITENVDDRVAALIQDSAGGGLTWTYDDSAGTLTPAYVGDSTLVTTGALNSGSITSGFGAIDIGSSALTAGAASFTTISGSTSLALASGATVTGIDNGGVATGSATLLATQGAIKTYVDAQVTAQDLDIISDSGNIDIDLDSESLTLAGGTGLASSASSTTVTFAIDSTVATLSGSQTLTNKTLTTPVISSISNTGTVTLPTSTDTLVGKATTDTLTNKSISGSTNTLSAIANGSLTNSTVAYGGVSLSLGGADTTPAFNLSDATAYPGDSSLVTTGTITSGTWQGTTVAVNQGGTGLASYAAGDIIYASGATTLAKLAKGSDTEVLMLASGVPTWASVGGDITGVTAGTGLSGGGTTGTVTLNVEAAQTQITSLGTIASLAAGDVSMTGVFTNTGTGPNCLAGGGAQGYRAFTARGGFTSDGSATSAAGWSFGMTITGAAGDTSAIELVKIAGSLTTQTVADQSVAVMAALSVDQPDITNNLSGTGTIGIASTLYIKNAPTEGVLNDALHIASGSSYFGGLVTTVLSTTSSAGLRLPHGAAPTSPVNGDIWTTTAGLYVRINGATVGPLTA